MKATGRLPEEDPIGKENLPGTNQTRTMMRHGDFSGPWDLVGRNAAVALPCFSTVGLRFPAQDSHGVFSLGRVGNLTSSRRAPDGGLTAQILFFFLRPAGAQG